MPGLGGMRAFRRHALRAASSSQALCLLIVVASLAVLIPVRAGAHTSPPSRTPVIFVAGHATADNGDQVRIRCDFEKVYPVPFVGLDVISMTFSDGARRSWAGVWYGDSGTRASIHASDSTLGLAVGRDEGVETGFAGLESGVMGWTVNVREDDVSVRFGGAAWGAPAPCAASKNGVPVPLHAQPLERATYRLITDFSADGPAGAAAATSSSPGGILAPGGAGANLSYTRRSEGHLYAFLYGGAAMVSVTGPSGYRRSDGTQGLVVNEPTNGSWSYRIHAGAANGGNSTALWLVELPPDPI